MPGWIGSYGASCDTAAAPYRRKDTGINATSCRNAFPPLVGRLPLCAGNFQHMDNRDESYNTRSGPAVS